MRNITNAAILSINPKTLAVSPACATGSGPFFRRDRARTMPIRAKGMAKDVRNTLATPNQKDREIKTLINPHTRLKIPVIPEPLLILLPPFQKLNIRTYLNIGPESATHLKLE